MVWQGKRLSSIAWIQSMKILFFPIKDRILDRGFRYLSIKNEITKAAEQAQRLLEISGKPLPKLHQTIENEMKVIIKYIQTSVAATKLRILIVLLKFLMCSSFFLNRGILHKHITMRTVRSGCWTETRTDIWRNNNLLQKRQLQQGYGSCSRL